MNEIMAKEEFFENLNQDKYFDFLRNKYNFYRNGINKLQLNFEIKEKKRRNMFSLKPNSKFLENFGQGKCKFVFFNKIKRKIKSENSPIKKLNDTNINSARTVRRKIIELPFLSERFLKTMKFNNDCHSIYEKLKNTLIK